MKEEDPGSVKLKMDKNPTWGGEGDQLLADYNQQGRRK
jgi:hypothetical protein